MNEVLSVINQFKRRDKDKIEEQYLCGDCYVFARALAEKFQGKIYYLAVDNHFITLIDENFYDIRGKVPDEEIYECYEWNTYKQLEPLDADRVDYYCIKGKEKLKNF